MTTLSASARLVNRQGVAERVFWQFLTEKGATLPNANVELVDRGGRGTPIFLDALSTVSAAPPAQAVELIDMRTGRPTPFFHKFLGGLP